MARPVIKNIYLDTCVAIRPFDTPPPDKKDLIAFQSYVRKSEQLIHLIGQGPLEWSTSDYFVRQFYRWVFNPKNYTALQNNTIAYQTLKHLQRLLKRAYRIKESYKIQVEAKNLQDGSANAEKEKLELEDCLHIIASFKAKVDKFLTYDYHTILKHHKGYIDRKGRQYNQNYSCENPVRTGFPDA